LIVDDHEAVRIGVRAILGIRPDIEVCGEAENGQEAVKKAQSLAPDVVILDVTMPIVDGFTAAREISKVAPHAAILLLSMHESPNLINVAKSSGAQGYIAKSEGSAVILRALDALAQHKTFFPDSPQAATTTH
jgi:DNA-binding NarL/FixJ family response regulator